MNMIRPVSVCEITLRTFPKQCMKRLSLCFLTKNGYGDMVVLSMEAFENLQFESEVYFKLQEAEREAELTDQRYSSKDVLKAMKAAIGGGAGCINWSTCLLLREIWLRSCAISVGSCKTLPRQLVWRWSW